jgi:hypothetical protein
VSKLFLDVLGNKVLVDGYQIEDSIAQKYNLKPGSICPFTGLRVETLSPQQVCTAEKTERQKIIKQHGTALGKEKQKLESGFTQKKETLSAGDTKISGYAADKKSTTKNIHPGESHDFASGRARSGRGSVKRNRIFKREEVRMATAKKVPAKPAKAAAKTPAKAKPPVKAPVKAATKPAKASVKAPETGQSHGKSGCKGAGKSKSGRQETSSKETVQSEEMILTHHRKKSAGNPNTWSGSRRITLRVGIGIRNGNDAGSRKGISMDSKGIAAFER